MKLNITPGEWQYKGKIVQDILGFDICDCDKTYLKDKFDNDNAIAIVIAVNNTYHKGINPEAVEELLQVAKALWKQNILDYESQEKLNRIIQKATL